MIIPTIIFLINVWDYLQMLKSALQMNFIKLENFHQTKMTKYTSDTHRAKKELASKLSQFCEE